jgi:hypothetical protein
MAILDLQGMQAPSDIRAAKSASSKNCGPSALSLLIC